ncbi:hypothetical protein SAMN05421833_107168 [Microbispora rosea]|uniref:Uncharacterized protein n=1 Tax=Microbispora rosea TaxID=58117 RepID=A0A1N6ZJD6_9ACTN|nr:hypothetical protein [Microbispora rosea]SIR27010.1 hypothetical protein SAMN05421833_107168 [Microbispora rosea]
MASGLARSRGRRRKRRARSHVVEVSLGVAAFAVGAVAIAWPLSRSDAEPGQVVAAPAPQASPAGELTVASVDTDKKPAAKRDKKAAEEKASGPSKYTDTTAQAYFRSRWSDKTAKRVKDIRSEGGYLRIYTNLPENADNSKTAITLCKRGLEYLAERGEANPVVFVQSRFGENGNPVLANVLGPDDDDCRVTYPEPK